MAEANLYILKEHNKNKLSELTDRYLEYKFKSLARNSQRVYSQGLGFLLVHCNAISDLNRQYLTNIINTTGSLGTKNLRKSIIDNFMDWCVKEGHLTNRPETEVYRTRREANEKNILTISERQLQILIAGIDDGNLRDVILVGFYMGLRISELAHLRPAWITGEGRFLRIGDLHIWKLVDEFHPKSQKEYDMPVAIPAPVKKVFERHQSGDSYRRMFGFASESTLRFHLRRIFKALPSPICDNFTAHHLRHSCISYWLNEKRVSVQEVQRLARHSRMETTMRYYHPDNDAHLRAFST